MIRLLLAFALVSMTPARCLAASGADRRPASPQVLVRTVAEAVLRDFPQPPPFNWGEGVLMAGMMRAYRLTGEERFRGFVQRWADHWAQRGIEALLNRRGYCGHWGPGLPLLLLYEDTRQARYLELADQINQFIRQKAKRTRDGGLSHLNRPVQLWVDTLFMCCPVLSHTARLTGRPQLQQEAVRQLELFAQHLQDRQSGLFYHMYDEQSQTRTDGFWCRGNGWVAMSYVEVLRHEPADSAARARLAAAFARQLRGLLPLQDAGTGLWHTVLDDPGSYLETSGSAMFLYAMAEARRLGLVDLDLKRPMQRAWRGLATKVSSDGRVVGVSAGTAARGRAYYLARPVGTYTWGTGAMLLAACAYAGTGQ